MNDGVADCHPIVANPSSSSGQRLVSPPDDPRPDQGYLAPLFHQISKGLGNRLVPTPWDLKGFDLFQGWPAFGRGV